VLTAASATEVAAQEQDAARWLSRFLVGKVIVGSTEGVFDTKDGEGATVTARNGIALQYDISRRVGASFLIQVGFGYWTFPSSVSVARTIRSTDVRADLDGFRSGELHFGVLYGHSLGGPVSVYGGPLVVASSRDVAEADGHRIRVDLGSSIGPGFQAGLQIGRCFSPRASFDINIRRSLLEPLLDRGSGYNLNPWLVSVGLSIQH
jgi:hypothetical protein